jgi:transcriptional regulator
MNKNTQRSVRGTTIDNIEDLLFKKTNKYDIRDKFKKNKILYNQKMILSKNLPHHNKDQIMKQSYDFYNEITDTKMNPLFIISHPI